MTIKARFDYVEYRDVVATFTYGDKVNMAGDEITATAYNSADADEDRKCAVEVEVFDLKGVVENPAGQAEGQYFEFDVMIDTN